jgi:zinc/manganese transport system substrate-binding protein
MLLALVAAAGCGGTSTTAGPDPTPARAEPLRVVATTTMLGDVARAVAGDGAEVRVLMAPGDDPRTFTIPAGADDPFTAADLVVATGLGFEAGLQPALDRAAAGGTTVLAAAELVAPMAGADGRADPHFWLDPDRVHAVGDAVADRLTALDPGRGAGWADHAAALGDELATADEVAQAALAPVPDGRRRLVTDSDGLGYLAARYGLTLAAAPAGPGTFAIDVDTLGPAGSPTATSAGLLTDTAARVASWLAVDR